MVCHLTARWHCIKFYKYYRAHQINIIKLHIDHGLTNFCSVLELIFGQNTAQLSQLVSKKDNPEFSFITYLLSNYEHVPTNRIKNKITQYLDMQVNYGRVKNFWYFKNNAQ